MNPFHLIYNLNSYLKYYNVQHSLLTHLYSFYYNLQIICELQHVENVRSNCLHVYILYIVYIVHHHVLHNKGIWLYIFKLHKLID